MPDSLVSALRICIKFSQSRSIKRYSPWTYSQGSYLKMHFDESVVQSWALSVKPNPPENNIASHFITFYRYEASISKNTSSNKKIKQVLFLVSPRIATLECHPRESLRNDPVKRVQNKRGKLSLRLCAIPDLPSESVGTSIKTLP